MKAIIQTITMVILIILTLVACTPRETPAPVFEGPISKISKVAPHHVVTKGETLYSIAWRYRMDFRDLARFNAIEQPYHLSVGQKLQLRGSPRVARAPKPLRRQVVSRQHTRANATAQTSRTTTKPKQVVKQRSVKVVPRNAEVKTWYWPVKGHVVKGYSELNKGLDIAGKYGQSIYASAPGEVVYSGSGLRGYGKLLIIKHNDKYLSAYAHNSRLLVREGQYVSARQVIAKMGRSSGQQSLLHFEIRQAGKPVNPTRFLGRNRT